MAVEVETGHRKITDASGRPVRGAVIYVNEPETTTLKTAYFDKNLSVTADNPIETDAADRRAIGPWGRGVHG